MNPFVSFIDRLSVSQWAIVNVITFAVCLGIFGLVVFQQPIGDSQTSLASIINSPTTPSPEPTPVPTPVPTPTPSPTPAPVGLRIPAIEIDTRIIEVGYIEETNEMEVPEKAEDVGWYKYGPPPGETGGTVMSGHFDTPTGAPAIFFRLGWLKEGDEFSIVNDISQEFTYKITKVANLPLAEFPKELIFGKKDVSQVTLMTCSGIWDAATQLYSNRLAVIGELQSVRNVEYIAHADPEEEALEQFVVQGFTIEEGERKEHLTGSYLRLEADQEKIKIYLGTDYQEANAMDAVISYDPSVLQFNEDLVAFTNEFAAHNVRIVQPGLMQVSLFTDPNWNSKGPMNTGNQEVKVAEVYYSFVEGNAQESFIALVKGQGQVVPSVLLTPNGQYIQNGIDILESVEGTVVPF